MNDGSRYYRDSGAVPMSGTLLMLSGGTAAAAISSFLYALLGHYNPFIYFNFLATFVLGVVVGLVVQSCGRRGHVRNRLIRRLVVLAVGGVTVIFAWISFVWIVTGFRLLVVDPANLWAVMQLFAANGLWDIRGFEPQGAMLYGVWGLEAAIIMGMAYQVGVGEEIPYCETCGRWTESDENETLLVAKTDVDPLRTALEDERYEILGELYHGDVNPSDCFQVVWHRCSGCSESNYLTLKHLRITSQKNDEESVESSELIRQLSVPQWLVEQLSEQAARSSVDTEQHHDAEQNAEAVSADASRVAETTESGNDGLSE